MAVHQVQLESTEAGAALRRIPFGADLRVNKKTVTILKVAQRLRLSTLLFSGRVFWKSQRALRRGLCSLLLDFSQRKQLTRFLLSRTSALS